MKQRSSNNPKQSGVVADLEAAMQSKISQFGFLALSLFLITTLAQAQYLVSSKAGFVNRVEGTVNLKSSENSLEALGKASMGTQMKEGDRLSTEAGGRAELLLSPGSYLRLNEKTEVEAIRTTFDNTRFDVIQGSVILEIGEIDKKLPLEIGTPRSVVTINKTGIYRIDVVGKDVAVSVRKGEAFLGTREQLFANSAIKIGGNKVYRLIGDAPPQTAKLSSKVFDAFDQWSYMQAESLVAANYGMLSRARSRGAMLSGWVYDPFSNRYTFIPGSWRYATPYGFAFYSQYAYCDWCWGGFSYPYQGGYYGGGAANSGGGAQPSAPARVTNDDRTASRVQTQRDVPSRQVEPYSRPSVFYPVERSSRYGSDSPSIFDSSRSTGSSPGYSSPMPSAPSRVDMSPASSSGGADRGSGGRGDTSRSTGGRGNQ
jgi:hypothetical protein